MLKTQCEPSSTYRLPLQTSIARVSTVLGKLSKSGDARWFQGHYILGLVSWK